MEELMKKEPVYRASIKTKLIRILVFAWLLPLVVLTLIMGFIVTRRSEIQVQGTVEASMDKAADLYNIQLDDCETLSKNASYYTDIRQAYLQYKADEKESVFAGRIKQFLDTQYKYNNNIKSAVVMFENDWDKIYFTYNNSTHATYKNIGAFEKNVKEQVLARSEELDTATTLIGQDGRIYLVRNLMLQNFTPYAVLVLELNDEALVKSLESVWGYAGASVYLDGQLLFGEEDLRIPSEAVPFGNTKFYAERGDYSLVISRMNKFQEDITAVVRIENDAIYARIRNAWIIYAIVLLFFFPLAIIIWHFFNKEITAPAMAMVNAYDAIRHEQYGIKIDHPARSREFWYMQESFNHMSDRLKQQFEKIYLEEIALRDAKIMTLQSQINPHFLNNTLEIINWEARLGGNYKVSSMIESLSVMLEATMNRKGSRYNSLSQEMAYVDAYLYIIAQRLGDGFHCEKEIDETLLDVQVPMLAVQPIVENAVEHGISLSRKGTIKIRLYEKEDYIYIEVENDQLLSPDDEQRIQHLLYGEIAPEKEKRVSLGIRNVHNRIKLIYGEECGLGICNNLETGHTVSTITIKRISEQ